MDLSRRKKVVFSAEKKVPKKVKVSFTTRGGKLVQFKAVKKVPRVVKVEFFARKNGG